MVRNHVSDKVFAVVDRLREIGDEVAQLRKVSA